MLRALASACLVLLLVGIGGSVARAAGGKPQIAILGLEVTDTGTGIDPQTTNVAKELTTELRQRAKAGTGQYTVAPGSEKELIDEKLLKNCDNEAPACMASIGNDLGAEILMYGRIEKGTDKGQPVYKVYIKLLNVGRKQLVSSTGESLPVASATPAGLAAAARTWYSKLTGSSDGGTLIVKANADRGTVLLDEDEKGTLSSGTVTIPRVGEGRHTLAIEAQGFERYEATVTVHNGETVSHGATLIELKKDIVHGGNGGGTKNGGLIEQGGTVSHSGGNHWKTIAIVSGIATAGFAGVYIYSTAELRGSGFSFPSWGHDCAKEEPKAGEPPDSDPCHFGRHGGNAMNIVGGIGAIAAGGFTLFAIMKARHSDEETRPMGASLRKPRKPEVAITPVLSPTGGGATLRFEW